MNSNPYETTLDISLVTTSETVSDGYLPSWDLNLTAEAYTPSHDLKWGQGGFIYVPTPTVLSTTFKSSWGKATPVANNTLVKYQKATVTDTQILTPYNRAEQLQNQFLLKQVRLLSATDKPYLLKREALFNNLDKPYLSYLVKTLKPEDITIKFNRVDSFKDWSTPVLMPYGVPPVKDIDYKLFYNSVRLYGVERIPIYETVRVGYTPSHDLDSSGIPYSPDWDLNASNIQVIPIGYTPSHDLDSNNTPYSPDWDLNGQNLTGKAENRGKIVGYEKTPIQPTGAPFKNSFGKFNHEINYNKLIPWGYGLNNFLVGGQWQDNYGGDTSPPIDPDEPINHPDYGVYIIMNTVNVTVLPGNEVINFENLNISYDVDSFAWSANLTITDKSSLDLIKPVGRTVKEIEISVNGTVFKMFVGKIQTRRNVAEDGTIRSTYNCQAWSNLKRLAHPYAAKKSYIDTTQTTAAQAVTSEAQPYGISVTWDTVDWNIPANTHGYQDKTPMGAILSVVNAIGGVIIPDKSTDGFTVKPRYPVSPWNWDDVSTTVDRTMDEARFFSIDNDTIPKDNPDGVFVYGDENGVGVKAVRIGRPGTALLPDVVDKYMTAVTAAQERGRIEVANNSFIELIPMSTYVDELGLIEPLDLIEFTESGGGTWRGMVVSFNLACERIGTALIQNITVARFFDDE